MGERCLQRLRRGVVFAIIISGAGFVSGCETTSKQDAGTVIGAILGGVVGHKASGGGAAGTAIGAVLGGTVGHLIGQYMDANDRREMAQALNENAPGESRSWRNPDTGNQYTMTPTSSVYGSEAGQCRDFVQEMIVDGERRVVNATACKRPDDESWRVT